MDMTKLLGANLLGHELIADKRLAGLQHDLRRAKVEARHVVAHAPIIQSSDWEGKGIKCLPSGIASPCLPRCFPPPGHL